MDWMLHRLVPLALAVVVGATPIAREICQATCAVHQPASTFSHEHHGSGHTPSGYGHRTAMPCCELSVSAGAHGCMHEGDALAASTPAVKISINIPAVVPQVVEAADPGGPTSLIYLDSRSRPPILLSLRTPLRV